MKFLMFLFMFFVLGGLFIIGEQHLYLRKTEHREAFFHLYLIWLSSVFDNARTITGQVLHLDWLPDH